MMYYFYGKNLLLLNVSAANDFSVIMIILSFPTTIKSHFLTKNKI